MAWDTGFWQLLPFILCKRLNLPLFWSVLPSLTSVLIILVAPDSGASLLTCWCQAYSSAQCQPEAGLRKECNRKTPWLEVASWTWRSEQTLFPKLWVNDLCSFLAVSLLGSDTPLWCLKHCLSDYLFCTAHSLGQALWIQFLSFFVCLFVCFSKRLKPEEISDVQSRAS